MRKLEEGKKFEHMFPFIKGKGALIHIYMQISLLKGKI